MRLSSILCGIAHHCLSYACHSIIIVCLDVCHRLLILQHGEAQRPVLTSTVVPHILQQWQQSSCNSFSSKVGKKFVSSGG